MPNYRIGTISVTNGSKAVVGSGTDFIAAGVMEGDELQLVDANLFGTGNVYEVASVTDATHLTLLQNYQGTTATGAAYVIKYTGTSGTQTNTALRLARFMNKWQSKYDAVNVDDVANGIPQADANGKISLGWIPSDYGTCSTDAATATKTVSMAGFVLSTGAHVRVKFANANSASGPVLNVNDTGAKAITFKGSTITELLAGVIYDFVYDGTNWELSYARNVANGYAGLNANGQLMPDYIDEIFSGKYSGSVITSYPTEPGIYRYAESVHAISGMPAAYGVLFIYGIGYSTHIFCDIVNDVLYTGALDGNIVMPSWQKVINAGNIASNLPIKALLGFTTKVMLTASGTWTAPVTGYYKFTLKGGGGGGGSSVSPPNEGGGVGGASGCEVIIYLYLAAGTTCTYTIGAGGASNTNGGITTLSVNGTSYSAAGGVTGNDATKVGQGSVPGSRGTVNISSNSWAHGGAGGGPGGGTSNAYTNLAGADAGAGLANSGGGGAGGSNGGTTDSQAGSPGGSGYIEIEYNSLS